MSLVLGPVLYFRGVRDRAWRLCALVAVAAGDQPAPLETEGERVPPDRLAERRGRELWRYDFALPLAQGEASGTTRSGRRAGGSSCRRCRVRCTSPTPPATAARRATPGTTAQRATSAGCTSRRRHAERPFHLLLQGGDQLYADPIWRRGAGARRVAAPASVAAPARALPAGARRGGRRRLLQALLLVLGPAGARRRSWPACPSLMMWDDHDIFDGWGSWSDRWLRCPTFRGIYAAAREHFALFQLGARPDELPEGFSDRQGGHFGWAYRIGEIGIAGARTCARSAAAAGAGRGRPARLPRGAREHGGLPAGPAGLEHAAGHPAPDPARATSSTCCPATRPGRTI